MEIEIPSVASNTIYPKPEVRDLTPQLPSQAQSDTDSLALPLFIIATLPGFGPVTISVAAIPLVIYGIRLGLSRGPNVKRMPKINMKALCFASHPNATHKHTISVRDFPYKKKLTVADKVNRAIHRVFGRCRKYVLAREHFFKKINKEALACEKDYYRLIDEDGFRNAWFLMHYEKDAAKAHYELEKVIKAFKEAPKRLEVKPSRDLMGLKLLLLKRLGRTDEFQMELKNFLKEKSLAFSEEEKENALEIFSLLALDENLDVNKPSGLDGLDVLQLWSKELLKNQDQNPTTEQTYPKMYLDSKPGKEYLIQFFNAIKNNFELLKDKDLLKHFVSSTLDGSIEQGGMTFLKTFYLDLMSIVPPFKSIKEMMQYMLNAAKADVNLNLFLEVQSSANQQKIIDNLSVDSLLSLVSCEEKGKFPLINTKLVILDTDSPNSGVANRFHDDIIEGIKGHQATFITCPSKKIYELLPEKHPLPLLFQQASELLVQQIVKALEYEKKQKVVLVSHHKGIEIVEKAFKSLPNPYKNRVISLIFSPSSLNPKMSSKEIYFHSPLDKVASKVVEYYEQFNFSKSLVQILIDPEKYRIKAKIPSSSLRHPIYKNKLIELINNFILPTF